MMARALGVPVGELLEMMARLVLIAIMLLIAVVGAAILIGYLARD